MSTNFNNLLNPLVPKNESVNLLASRKTPTLSALNNGRASIFYYDRLRSHTAQNYWFSNEKLDNGALRNGLESLVSLKHRVISG